MVQKEKCDCQGLMLAALAVGALIGLVGGLAIGWNGAIYPSETNFILSFLTAIGTVGAAFGAVYAAYVALSVSKREAKRIRRENRRYARAQHYILCEWGIGLRQPLNDIKEKFDKLRSTPQYWRYEDYLAVLKSLAYLDIDRYPIDMERIHKNQDGADWAFSIARAANLKTEIELYFKDRKSADSQDLSTVLLSDKIDDLAKTLNEICALYLRESE